MLNKFVAAALTATAISGILTVVLSFNPFFDDFFDDNYFSFFDFFVMCIIFSFPVIFISGILVDWLKKRVVSSSPARRKTGPLLYGGLGSIIALVILLFLHDGTFRFSDLSVLLPLLMLCGALAILYFWISQKILKKSHNPHKK